MRRHILIGHILQTRRAPVRLVILVDQNGPHAFIEVMAVGDDAIDNAELHLEVRIKIQTGAAPELFGRDLHGGGRFLQHFLARLLRPRIAVSCQRFENGLHARAHEMSIDSVLCRPQRRITRIFMEAGQHVGHPLLIERAGVDERLAQLGQTRQEGVDLDPARRAGHARHRRPE